MEESTKEFKFDKLVGRIIEKYGNQIRFAKAMSWSERTLSQKMNGKTSWKQTDICKAINLLGLSISDIQEYFFTIKVQII